MSNSRKWIILDASGTVLAFMQRPVRLGPPAAEVADTPGAVTAVEITQDVPPEIGRVRWNGSGFEALPTPAPSIERLKTEAKRARQNKEAAGTDATLANGSVVTVDTARDDIAALTGVLVRAQAGALSFPLTFKGGGAFYQLAGPGDLEALAAAASAHVQAAYEAEAQVVSDIEAGAITTVAEVSAAFEA